MHRKSARKRPLAAVSFRKLSCEPLEDRRLLAVDAPQMELFGLSPALFVENRGQWADSSIRFMHQGNGANVAMTDAGPVFQLFRSETQAEPTPDAMADPTAEPAPVETLQFSAHFVGANAVTPVGLNAAETKFNYFVGDRANWQADVPGYELVSYPELYDGIELQTSGLRSHLKYEFHVAPGADYRQIQVQYEGIGNLSLAADGSLVVQTSFGELVDDAPYVYQVIDGKQVAVAGHFRLLNATTYTFDVTGPFDPNRELVIDPDLAWATYLGGSALDEGRGITVDDTGNAWVTGLTSSIDFGGANNTNRGSSPYYRDAFVAKITCNGSLAWTTYLGGSSWDQARDIAIDASGNAWVTGVTSSTDFAGANNGNHGSDDAFVAKITSAGMLAWATYLGGAGGEGSGDCNGIALDDAGNAWVTGTTVSIDFPAANNSYHGGGDVFVAKVASSGSLVWATYLGGEYGDRGHDIAVASDGTVFVTGYTDSNNFVGANNHRVGFSDAYVSKLNGDGTLAWSTYLGGYLTDIAYGIAVDLAGNIWVTGYTQSSTFPGANNRRYDDRSSDAFVAMLNKNGSVVWATYLGGREWDRGYGITVDLTGSAWVMGWSSSPDFAGANNNYHSNYPGDWDAFMAKVTNSGSLAWATYVGGTTADYGYAVATDRTGNVWVTGSGGVISLGNANDYHGEGDAFVVKIRDGVLPPENLTIAFNGTAGMWTWKDPGTWSPLHNLTPVWVVTGDVDGNGKQDLIANFGGSTGIWIHRDTGVWQWLHNLPSTAAVMADTNGDGRDELIMNSSQPGTAGLLGYYPATGKWRYLSGWQGESLAAGDFDGNGKQDVAVDFGANGLWFLNNDAAWQWRHSFNPTWMTAGDMDGNGKDDLTLSFDGANTIWTLRDTGVWQWLLNLASSNGLAADADADGRAELFITVTDVSAAGLWEYSPKNALWRYVSGWKAQNLIAADVDGNGTKDIAADFGANGLWLYKNDSAWQWLHSLDPAVMTGARSNQAAAWAVLAALDSTLDDLAADRLNISANS